MHEDSVDPVKIEVEPSDGRISVASDLQEIREVRKVATTLPLRTCRFPTHRRLQDASTIGEGYEVDLDRRAPPGPAGGVGTARDDGAGGEP